MDFFKNVGKAATKFWMGVKSDPMEAVETVAAGLLLAGVGFLMKAAGGVVASAEKDAVEVPTEEVTVETKEEEVTSEE